MRPEEFNLSRIAQRIKASKRELLKRRLLWSENHQSENLASDAYEIIHRSLARHPIHVKALRSLPLNATNEQLATALLGGPEAISQIALKVLVGNPASNERDAALQQWIDEAGLLEASHRSI